MLFLLFVSGLPQSVYKDLDHNTRSLFAPAQLVSFPPNETVQTPQVPSGNVAAAQATLSLPAATAQVSSAASAAERKL